MTEPKKGELVTTTIRLPKELHRQVLILCATQAVSMQYVITNFLKNYVEFSEQNKCVNEGN